MPQRGLPYVHMGRNIVLYSRSLFPIDICECLPMIQYIRLNESSNCFLLAFMCVLHVSRRSKCNPSLITWFVISSQVRPLSTLWLLQYKGNTSVPVGMLPSLTTNLAKGNGNSQWLRTEFSFCPDRTSGFYNHQ